MISWVLVFGAIGAAAASWFTPRPLLDADDATRVAVDALADVGFDGEVVGEPRRVTHAPAVGHPVTAWAVLVDVADETIELRVQESAGQLVYVDDNIGPDDTERLLTDAEFDALGRYLDDAVRRRWIVRNGAGTVAAALVAAVGVPIVKRSDRLWR